MARMVPSVPSPTGTTESLQVSVEALKESVEVLTGTHSQFHTPTAPKTAVSISIDAALAAVKRMNP
jgi:hypothetical protein